MTSEKEPKNTSLYAPQEFIKKPLGGVGGGIFGKPQNEILNMPKPNRSVYDSQAIPTSTSPTEDKPPLEFTFTLYGAPVPLLHETDVDKKRREEAEARIAEIAQREAIRLKEIKRLLEVSGSSPERLDYIEYSPTSSSYVDFIKTEKLRQQD
jgi:hypothetical protein